MVDRLVNAARILAGQHPAKTQSDEKAGRELHEGVAPVAPHLRSRTNLFATGRMQAVKTVLCRIAGADWAC